MKEKTDLFYVDSSWVIYQDYASSDLCYILSMDDGQFFRALNGFFIPQEILLDFYNKIKTLFFMAKKWNKKIRELIISLYHLAIFFKIPFENSEEIKKYIWNIWFLDENWNMNWYYSQLCHFCIWIDGEKITLKNPFCEDKIELVIDL